MPRRPDQPQPPEDTAGHRSAAGNWSAADQLVLADRPARWSREGLRQRLDRLPEWHPSSPDQPKQPGGDRVAHLADGPRVRPEPLSDAEHADRVGNIRARLADARDRGSPPTSGSSTRRTTGGRPSASSSTAILSTTWTRRPLTSRVTTRRSSRAGWAGKPTVLDEHAGIDRSQYLTINPDDIKEAMARRGLIPELDGLSPMEASDLVHAESSHVVKRLARRAMDDGKNIIWDITMSSRRPPNSGSMTWSGPGTPPRGSSWTSPSGRRRGGRMRGTAAGTRITVRASGLGDGTSRPR